MKTRACTIPLLLLPLLLVHCAPARPVSEAAFLIPFLRGGWTRPEAPRSLTARYSLSTTTLNLNWTGSLDPETGLPNVIYNIYAYETPPKEYYRPQDILDATSLASYYRQIDPFTGTLYFVVTAFDGGAESLPSNVAEMQTTP